ncbi:hypothetical protein K27_27125 [Klebsiella pneumoniae]|nr:hypothetical protein K27_27125 [Klebsiella pneumoniae]
MIHIFVAMFFIMMRRDSIFTLLPVVSILLTESCIWEKMRTLPALELSVSLKEYMVSQKQRLLQTDDLRA